MANTWVIPLVLLLTPSTALCQPADSPVAEAAWAITASAATYVVPDDRNYVQPTVTADRGRLHLEGRYNYEGQSTASAWLGYNFAAGETVTLELTPMAGVVFGDTNGLAPGYRVSLGWRRLEAYSESELVIDPGDTGNSYLYSWNELTWSPVDWFRAGLVAQRTRAYESDLDIQRGVLAGFSIRRMEITGHVFNWGWTDPTYVVSLAVHF